MTIHVTSRRVALAAAGGLLAAVPLSGAAQAITDTVFKYTTVKTGYFGIDVMAMAPQTTAAANDYSISWTNGISTSAGYRCFNAGVNLPNGATMTRLSIWYTNGGSSNPHVQLLRHTLATGLTQGLAFATIVDDSGTRKQKNFAIADGPLAKVNNGPYTYGFGVCIGTNAFFHGARVTYTYNNAGD